MKNAKKKRRSYCEVCFAGSSMPIDLNTGVRASPYARTEIRHLHRGNVYELRMEIHHLRPLGCGGTNARENLITLCPVCHKTEHITWGGGGGGPETSYRGPMKRVQFRVALIAIRIANWKIRTRFGIGVKD